MRNAQLCDRAIRWGVSVSVCVGDGQRNTVACSLVEPNSCSAFSVLLHPVLTCVLFGISGCCVSGALRRSPLRLSHPWPMASAVPSPLEGVF